MQSPAVARAFVALGSNMRSPKRQVRVAIEALKRLPDSRLLASSGLYLTPPWGDLQQPHFINAVVELETQLSPHALLAFLLAIEQAMGRVRSRRYGPRVIDLDLLCHGDAVIAGQELCLPHPRMHERAFVMRPLAEIAPQLPVASYGRAEVIVAALDCAAIVRVAESQFEP